MFRGNHNISLQTRKCLRPKVKIFLRPIFFQTFRLIFSKFLSSKYLSYWQNDDHFTLKLNILNIHHNSDRFSAILKNLRLHFEHYQIILLEQARDFENWNEKSWINYWRSDIEIFFVRDHHRSIIDCSILRPHSCWKKMQLQLWYKTFKLTSHLDMNYSTVLYFIKLWKLLHSIFHKIATFEVKFLVFNLNDSEQLLLNINDYVITKRWHSLIKEMEEILSFTDHSKTFYYSRVW